jgi:transcriptional regulator with GAF, ATPase, and Fis domain
MNHTNRNYDIIGESAHTRAVLKRINDVAPYDVNVLITGETGTGKELVAVNIHRKSPRATKPFETLNCSAMPVELAESELFGYDKGAFTGSSYSGKPGYFEIANQGTLFLDEIGTMNRAIQPKILRAVEYGAFRRLGSTSESRADVRIISATNNVNIFEDPEFRRDLLYRLAVEVINLEPLSSRQDDIEPIAINFLDAWGNRNGRVKTLSADALAELMKYEFPGNVRELQLLLQRAYIVTPGNQIEAGAIRDKIDEQRARYYQMHDDENNGALTHMDGDRKLVFDEHGFRAGVYPWDMDSARRLFNADNIVAAIVYNDGNVGKAAKLLGTPRSNLYKLINKGGTTVDEFFKRHKIGNKYRRKLEYKTSPEPTGETSDADTVTKHPIGLWDSVGMLIEEKIKDALAANDGNVVDVAKQLGIPVEELHNHLNDLEIDPSTYEK